MSNLDFTGLWLDVTAKYLERNSTRLIVASIFTLLVVVPIYRSRRQGLGTSRLQGPRSESFIFGNTKKIFPSANLSLVYRDWERLYGPVYEIPTGIGSSHIVLSDPKAFSHIFSKDTTTYHVLAGTSALSKKLFGDVVAAIEGETHKRLRRALSSPLSVSAVRNLTHVCLDSAYQLKTAWDTCSQSSEKSNKAIVIDVDKWMNSVTLDTIGKAILSHDFGTLKGHTSSMMTAFDSIHTVKPSLFLRLIYFFAPILYALFKVTFTSIREQKLAQSVAQLNVLTTDLLSKARKEPENIDVDESVLGILAKSENANPNSRLSLAEITTQSFLFMAAYETTAITLTWSLIELARQPEIQETLRAELTEYLAEGERPTYDHLTKDLKYLDAFIAEILRLHAPEMQAVRAAAEDDVIPLTDPIRTAAGAMIDSVFVRKGTVVRVPLGGVNMSEALWGPDAGTFNPDRWLDAGDHKRKGRREELPGYRGLLTFGAGPRMCPGRDLAVLEVKAVLSVLVGHFAFEFPDGPSTELAWHFTRPKVAGKDGTKVPLLVRRLT